MRSKLNSALGLILSFSLTISAVSYGQNEDILLTVHDRMITTSEFLYFFEKNYNTSEITDIDSYLPLFIDMQLKLAHARDENLHRKLPLMNDIIQHRIRLAEPWLTHKEKEEQFAREAYERLKYEVKASHILIRSNPDHNPKDTLAAYNKALQIRKRILSGESFEKLALKYSDDNSVNENSGDLGYFTAFQSEYNFETAVFNMTPGELSLPLRTKYGYHIVRCDDKRQAAYSDNQELPPYERMKEILIKWIKDTKDIRTDIIRKAFADRLKKEWNLTVNREVLKTLLPYVDDQIYTGDWMLPDVADPQQAIATIDGRDVKLKDFADFITTQESTPVSLSYEECLDYLLDIFIDHRLLLYENYKLEEKYPEFRNAYREYRDASLLLEITNKQVWLKSVLDTVAISDYFEQNRNRYVWGERLTGAIFTANDKKTAELAKKNAARSIKRSKSINDWFTDYYQGENKSNLTVQQDTFSRGENPLVDEVKWKKGIYGIYQMDNKYSFVVVNEYMKPMNKTFAEAYDEVTEDYQSHLMNEWLNDLRNKYHVEVNNDILEELKSRIYSKPVVQLDFGSPTADKPQSKLWYMFDTWWALLPRSSGPSLWQRTDNGWVEHTGVAENLTDIPGRVDVWQGRRSVTAVGVGERSLTVFRLTGEADSLNVTWRSRVLTELIPPVCVDPIETATIAQDGVGDWWVAAVVDKKVYVWNSSSVGRKWSSPVLLGEGIDADDICVITPIPEGVGVIWSDQVRDAIIMREHKDGTSPEKWSEEIIVDSGNKTADDHLNTSLSSNGTLWVTSKNSLDTPGKPQFVLRIRTQDGKWINRPYLTLENRMKRPSRPIVIAAENDAPVFAGHGDNDRSVPVPYNAVIVFSVIDTTKSDIFNDPRVVIFPFPSYNSFVQNVTGPRNPFPEDADQWIILASDAQGRVYEADLRKLVREEER